MSVLEQCVAMLYEMDAEALAKAESYIRFLLWESRDTAEDEDDAFCEALYQKYLQDPDRGETESLIHQLAIECYPSPRKAVT